MTPALVVDNVAGTEFSESEESRAIDPDGWLVRQTDYDFLTSPEAREILQQEGINVIDYKTIQQSWFQTSTQ